MNSVTKVLIITCIFLSLSNVTSAQVILDTTNQKAAKTEDSIFVMKKSPGGAALRSALMPGLGQFYNASYWKIPIIFGLGGYLVYGFISNNNLFIKYRDEYAASIHPLFPDGDLNIKLYREFYRDQRDTYGWFFGLLYLVQIADAFVDAHLFDFNVDDGAHASMILTKPREVTLQIRW